LPNPLTFTPQCGIIYIVKRETSRRDRGKCRKENIMDEMNACEMIKELAEENQTRKILEILEKCNDLEEAKEKIKALLNK
jgi:hypothetical protein